MPRKPPLGVAANIDTQELRRAFRAAARVGIPASLKKGHKAIGEFVITKAKPRVPVGPDYRGHVRDSLRASNTSWVAQVKMGTARRFPYAPLIHWGSSYRPNMPPRPVITEAAEQHQAQIARMELDNIQGELDKLSAA